MTLVQKIGHVTGSDPNNYAQEMMRLADKLGVGHVVDIQGFCDTPIDFLRRLDVYAFASISEGFGIVLLEAMAEGLPIVASNIYPINHIIIDDETGILVSPTKPDEFAVAIMRLINDQTMKDRIGVAGMKRCRNEFTEQKTKCWLRLSSSIPTY